MGILPAPSFANIYLARRLDKIIAELGKKYGENGKSAFKIFKRFLDDLFQVFTGTTKQLHELFNEINKIHPTLKFTMMHTTVDLEAEEDRFDCVYTKSIPFLDTSLQIEMAKLTLIYIRKKLIEISTYCLPAVTQKAQQINSILT